MDVMLEREWTLWNNVFLSVGIRPSQISYLYKGPVALISPAIKVFLCYHTEKLVIEVARADCSAWVRYGVRSPKFIWAPVYSLAETPPLSPFPAFGLIYEGAIGQTLDRRHLIIL